MKKDGPQIKKKKKINGLSSMKCSDDREEDKWSFSINLETSAECFSRGLKIIPHPRRSTRRILERGGTVQNRKMAIGQTF